MLDADTSRPIPDAVVSCSWAFTRGVGNHSPEARRAASVKTDIGGRYWIPALRDLPIGLSTRLSHFAMVVYKRGYAAYRHQRKFNQRQQHKSFSQRENLIRLSRWSPELSHARHLLFIGGGAALSSASKWEALAAARDLDRQAREAGAASRSPQDTKPTPDQQKSNVRLLLSSDEVRKVTGYKGAFIESRLKDNETKTFSTWHFKAKNKSERYDVAVRVWRLDSTEIHQQYDKLLNDLTGSKQTDEVGDKSFTVLQGEILGLGFLDRTSSVVVLLTCGRGQCTEDKHLLELGNIIQKNLVRLDAVEDLKGVLPGESEDGLQQKEAEDSP